jgi:signal transduction histidine kinase
MGLGLTLVKRVVEAHRGTVEVETSDTTGTRFSLLLPVSLPVDPRNAEPMVGP